jgi:hypothetical protein
MIRNLTYCALCLSFAAVINTGYFATGDDALQKKLYDIDQMRNGKNTPLEQVESHGRELLSEYTKPEDQGQILFHLTEIHGQSGMAHPDLVIQHAQNALQLPLDTFQRLRLYVYWGDAIRSENLHKPIQEQKPFSEIRTLAVKPYLEGLKEMQQYKIPDKMPSLPGVDAYDVFENDPHYKEVKKRHDDQMAARLKAKNDQNLWINRNVLTNQIVDMYSRPPYAAAELRQLAAKILDKTEQVDALMKRVEERGALKDDHIPEKKDAKSPTQ